MYYAFASAVLVGTTLASGTNTWTHMHYNRESLITTHTHIVILGLVMDMKLNCIENALYLYIVVFFST